MPTSIGEERRAEMRKSQVFVGVLLLVTAVLAVGCAKPPQQEIDAVKAALTAAEQGEAPKYAAEAWDKAQQGMNAVNAALEAGIAGKEKAKNDAKAAIDAAKAAMDGAGAMFASIEKCPRAKRAKEGKKDPETGKGNLEGYKNQITELDGKFASEDFFGAKAQADTLKGLGDPVAKDLEGGKD